MINYPLPYLLLVFDSDERFSINHRFLYVEIMLFVSQKI